MRYEKSTMFQISLYLYVSCVWDGYAMVFLCHICNGYDVVFLYKTVCTLVIQSYSNGGWATIYECLLVGTESAAWFQMVSWPLLMLRARKILCELTETQRNWRKKISKLCVFHCAWWGPSTIRYQAIWRHSDGRVQAMRPLYMKQDQRMNGLAGNDRKLYFTEYCRI